MVVPLLSFRQNQTRCCSSLNIQLPIHPRLPTASHIPRNSALHYCHGISASRKRRQCSLRSFRSIHCQAWTPQPYTKFAPDTRCWKGHERSGHGGLKYHWSPASSIPESGGAGQKEELPSEIFETLQDAADKFVPDNLSSWRRLFALMQDKHGAAGTWACFELLRERHQLHITLQDKASQLREDIIKSAAEHPGRLETMLHVAIRLRAFSREWPDLYANTVHALLAREDYDNAIVWHQRLSQHFPPGPEVLGGLISNFVGPWDDELLTTLSTIYSSSPERGLYDYLIPALYDSGASKLARVWRKKLIAMGDIPLSMRSKPFVQFLVRYYPAMELAPEELALLRGTQEKPLENDQQPEHPSTPKFHGDEFVAKWFATSWLSVEFAINFLRSVGVHTIGARSLQALALREGSAQGVVQRVAQLEKSDIQVAQGAYCQALVFFARNGEDRLLDKLLHTEVHPNDFDDATTRSVIVEAAAEANDLGQTELFQGVERALHEDAVTEPHQLDTMLHRILDKRRVGKAMVLLDRMDALKVNPDPRFANKLLKRAFWGVGKHPMRYKRGFKYGEHDPQLDRAIYVARRLSSHNISMPLKNWAALLFSLGRTGRFEELLQLSLEVTKFYKPTRDGLIPVRLQDTPAVPINRDAPSKAQDDLYYEFSQFEQELDFEGPFAGPSKKSAVQDDESQDYELQDFEQNQDGGIQYIPSDLPFTHQQHPINQLFPAFLQRAIVRWGFDQTLKQEPKGLPKKKSSQPGLADFDVAKGVRVLAILRDQGVLIDPQIIRSAIYQRISVGRVSTRRHWQRDSTDVDTQHVKRLVDDAWGSELLPKLTELNRSVEKNEKETQRRYPILFDRTYNNSRRYNLHQGQDLDSIYVD